MNEEVIRDEELGLVFVFNHDNLDPNGEPECVEYTIEEYDSLNK